jgi:murein DD-endopeptidase MepM/ murein hydrolase activator NlpD
MSLTAWLKRRVHRTSPRAARRPPCRFAVPRLEELEGRITPTGSITLTDAFVVNAHDLPVTPDIGEEVFIQANFTTQGLPSNASYRVSYSVDGVILETGPLTWGAGDPGTEFWYAYWGGWFASPGTHNVTVTIDPTTYGTTSRNFSFTPVSAPDLPQQFITPLGGTPFQTWGIVNYVDVDPRGGVLADYQGGPYTYDGHSGHDLTLANFGSMDAGVPDYAAADGTVVAVQDGNYDRNRAMATYPPANYVEIDHGNGWHTIYYHLRTDTILVHVGDTVVQGQVIGLAGSSGNSTAAHLHFEVQHNGDVVEPEYDPNTYWANPLPYQGSFSSVLDSGVTSSASAFLADFNVEERTPTANVFTQAAGQQIVVWFTSFTRNGDSATFRFHRPDGTDYTPLDYTFSPSMSRGGSWYISRTLPGNLDLGTWHVGIELNGTEMASDAFQVTAGGAAAARVTQGGPIVPNGRTTPVDFGTVAPGSTPPQRTFTVSNLGSTALTLSNLVLPSGFTLVGSFPSSIAVGGSATFTIQMATSSSGTDAGILSFNTNDPSAPSYSFDVKGVVSGGNTGEIHGQVFSDVDGDGIENGPEGGLAGWTVKLLNPADDSVLATTTTGFNGYYAFYNLAPGTYRVRETPPAGWTQSTPNPADVTVGTGDVLASPFGVGVYLPTHFTVSAPANATAGTAVTFTVTALDAFNHVAGGYTGTVHFTSADSQASKPADATLTYGIGTFSATLRTAGSQDITATDTGDGSITGSASVAVNPAAADHLIFLGQPTNSSAGQTITPAVMVAVVDQFGNLITGDNSDVVTLTIGANPSGGTLSGTLTVTVSAGIATFGDLSIDQIGDGYTLVAAVGGLTGAESNPFSITA